MIGSHQSISILIISIDQSGLSIRLIFLTNVILLLHLYKKHVIYKSQREEGRAETR